MFNSPKTIATLVNFTCKSFIKLMKTVMEIVMMMMMMMMMIVMTIMIMLMIIMITYESTAFGRLFLAKFLTKN